LVVYYLLDMGRTTYVCATCSEHFIRRYSVTRHNFTIHDDRGEIVPLLKYIIGRKTGRIGQAIDISGGVAKKTTSITLDILMQP
jgi:hypothetical protein